MYKKIIFFLITGILIAGTGCGSKSTSSAPPPVPPLTPAQFTALSGDQEITLTWSPSADAAGYVISSFDTANSKQLMKTASASPFTDTSLTNGVLYEYTISAYNDAGTSPDSQTMGIPSFLTATTVTSPVSGISLTWSAVTAPVTPTGYTVFYSSNQGDQGSTITTSAAYIFTGLTSSALYSFTVTADLPGYSPNIGLGQSTTATAP